MPHQRHDGLRFPRVVRTKAKDVISGDSERRRGATLADNQNIVRIRVWLDHGHLGARLRPDDNFHAAPIEVLNSVQRL